jgi:hypothetical protein
MRDEGAFGRRQKSRRLTDAIARLWLAPGIAPVRVDERLLPPAPLKVRTSSSKDIVDRRQGGRVQKVRHAHKSHLDHAGNASMVIPGHRLEYV